MKEIQSLNNLYIKELVKLKEKKHREEQSKYLIEGFHLVEEAKKAGCLETVLICNQCDYIEDIENILVTPLIIEKISQTISPQHIIGICKIKNNLEIEGKKFLLLDNINDPGNLGTLIRSALGFNIDCVIVSNDTVDIYNDKVIRASQGALFHLPIIKKDLLETIEYLQKQNVEIIGTSLKNSKKLQSLFSIEKYAILLGNEASGVRLELLEKTNTNVQIEMNSRLESLNVAIAGAIIMYYLNNAK